jgi:hypothetical protein
MTFARFALATLVAACSHNDAATPPAQPTPSPPPAPPPPATGSATATPAAASPGSPDITKACSMISAAEVSAIVGFPVTATDEGFRCKFTDAKSGWISLELMQAELRGTKDICEYAKDKRTNVAGVGDRTSYFGSTVCTILGDVAIIVDGANVAEHSEQLRKSGADNVFVLVAKTVASRIP